MGLQDLDEVLETDTTGLYSSHLCRFAYVGPCLFSCRYLEGV